MKICLCTTPIRPKPTTYPPFGSLAVIQALRKVGENTKFHHKITPTMYIFQLSLFILLFFLFAVLTSAVSHVFMYHSLSEFNHFT